MDEKSKSYDISAIKAELLTKMGEHAGDYPVMIEQRIPHILARIAELWGTAELDSYLEVLMLPDRQDRAGFPPEVAMEVFRLTNVHAALGLAPKINTTGWAGVEESARDKTTLIKHRY